MGRRPYRMVRLSDLSREPETLAGLPVDTEIRDEFGKHVIRIREGQGFWSIPLSNWVRRRWPSLVVYRTGTVKEMSWIYIFWTSLDDPRKLFFGSYGRDRGVYGSLVVPLTKLNLQVPRDEQWEVPVHIVEFSDAPFALLLKLTERKIKKRKRSRRKSRAKGCPPPM